MAAFKDYMTKDGQALITKMLAGQCKIQFTRLVFGDGYLPAGTDPRNMTELISPKYETIAVAGKSGQVVTVAGTFTNKDLSYATYLREKGVYATDGDKEVLVIYANNGNEAECIQPSDTALIEKVIRSVLQFGQDDIVSIEVASGIYVTVENYQQDKIIMENTITERFEQVNTVIQEMQEYECKIAPRYVTDIAVESGDEFVKLTWKDPGETFIDGVKIAMWDGTKLVMNDEHYPEGVDDGTLLLDNTEKNKYQSEGFKVEGLVNRQNYFFRFFPYCVCGGVNDYSDENKIVGTPGLIPTNPVTNISAIQNDASIVLRWTDPEVMSDKKVTWSKTVVVYKTGSFPADITDGTVIESTVNNQYQTNGLAVNGVSSGVMYYFSLFPVSTDGVINTDKSQRVSFMPQLEIGTVTGISANQSGSYIELSWTDPEDSTSTGVKWGKTVVVYKTGSYPTLMTDGTVITETSRNQYKSDGLIITGIESGKTYYFSLYPVASNGTVNTSTTQRISIKPEFAVINVSTSATDLYGKTVTATIGGNSTSGVFNSSGKCVLYVPWKGTATIKCEQSIGISDPVTVNISSMTTYSVTINFLKLVTWASGTWAQIKAMLDAHYAGKINITDYWSVGDVRTIPLSGGNSSVDYNESNFPAKNVSATILGFNHDTLSASVGTRTKAAVTIKIASIGQLSIAYDDDGYTQGYSSIYTNTYGAEIINTYVFGKRIPADLKALSKKVSKKIQYSSSNNTHKVISSDMNMFPFSIGEVIGNNSFTKFGLTLTFNDGTQYDYFKTSANILKMNNTYLRSHVYAAGGSNVGGYGWISIYNGSYNINFDGNATTRRQCDVGLCI